MSHNVYARRPAIWCAGSVPNARDIGLWDGQQYKAIDGVNGGTWEPTSPIVIGGAGVVTSGAGSSYLGATTQQGGRLRHGDSDYVQLSPAVTRIEMVSLTDVIADMGPGVVGGMPFLPAVLVFGPPRGVCPLPALGPVSSLYQFVVPLPSRCLHQGANLTLASLYHRALVRQSAPAPSPGPYYLQANVFGVTADGSTSVQLVPTLPQWTASFPYLVGAQVIPANYPQTGLFYVCTGAGTSAVGETAWPPFIGDVKNDGSVVWKAEGFSGIPPNPQSGPGNTYANGLLQGAAMSVASSGSPFVIDCTTYDYYLAVTYDSYGPGTADTPNWMFHSLGIAYSGIADMRPE